MIQTGTNLYGLIGILAGSVSGVVIAMIHGKKNAIKKESEELIALRKEVDLLTSKLETLKVAFTLVFDEMERDMDAERLAQLKQFKKIFDL